VPRATSKTPASLARKSSPAPQGLAPGYLPHDLGRVMNALNAKMMAKLRPMELTIQQFRVLQFLRSVDSATIGGICADTVIEQSVVSRIVDQLQKRGFAVRNKPPTNARIVEVSITPVGSAVLDSLRPHAMAIVDDATAGLSPEDRATLQRLLSALLQRIRAQ
jgi:DNA-binding MarR family transcriptional regulator